MCILSIFEVPRHFAPWGVIFKTIAKSLQGHWLQCPDIVLAEFGADRLENVPHSLAHTIGFYPYEAVPGFSVLYNFWLGDLKFTKMKIRASLAPKGLNNYQFWGGLVERFVLGRPRHVFLNFGQFWPYFRVYQYQGFEFWDFLNVVHRCHCGAYIHRKNEQDWSSSLGCTT